MEDELKYWLLYSLLEGIGSLKPIDIFNHFGSMKNAFFASPSEWREITSLKDKTISNIKERYKKIDIDNLENILKEKDVKVVTYIDKKYPEVLKNIYNPPAVLYYKGDFLSKNFDNALAVVGSRKCSQNAIENTKNIISGLKNTEVIIISGGARGIDTVSHKAALENNLETIVVLGGGLDNIYPKENKQLFEKIIENNGAVISEYFPTVMPDVFRFPERNRIISGLSKGTLVAEAGEKSGALITARLCLEQGKELMCLPGLLSNPNTKGTHNLLKQGASLVTSSEDIINYLNLTEMKENKSSQSTNLELSNEEKEIFDILELEPKSVQEILNGTKIEPKNVMIILTMLELKGIIKQLPGEIYTRA